MSVTIRDIKAMYPGASVEQVNSMQLFIVMRPNALTVLVSYRTIVGVLDGMCWLLTTKEYSPTTMKQLTTFARLHNSQRVDKKVLDKLILS